VVARSKAWVCGCSRAGTAGSNPAGGMNFSLVSVVCCQAEFSTSFQSLNRGRTTECGVSECVAWYLGNEEALSYKGMLRRKGKSNRKQEDGRKTEPLRK